MWDCLLLIDKETCRKAVKICQSYGLFTVHTYMTRIHSATLHESHKACSKYTNWDCGAFFSRSHASGGGWWLDTHASIKGSQDGLVGISLWQRENDNNWCNALSKRARYTHSIKSYVSRAFTQHVGTSFPHCRYGGTPCRGSRQPEGPSMHRNACKEGRHASRLEAHSHRLHGQGNSGKSNGFIWFHCLFVYHLLNAWIHKIPR